MWDELFYHVGRGELPPGSHFYYDQHDPLGRLLHAIGASPELDSPLPPPRAGSWRRAWLAALERHWPLDDAERRLHLAALESSLLSLLRQRRASGGVEARLRAFLRTLGSPCAAPPWCDEFLRWLPLDPASSRDWFDQALRLTGQHAAGGASYEVLFPGTWGDETGLIRARLTRLESAADAQPRVVLAAWSDYLLVEKDAARLGEQLGSLAEQHPEQLGNERFLLELLRLEGEQFQRFTPPTVMVEGQSLGLAVLLAAWAARSQPSLMPLIATGQLLDGEVRGVASVYEKSDVVREFLLLRQPHRFLVPAENHADVRSDLLAQFPDRVVSVAHDVNALFARTDLLTDGCAAYRALLAESWSLPVPTSGAADTFGRYDDDDRRRLAEIATKALAPGTLAATPLPFGNQPRLAMRQILARSRDEELIALPLSLAEDAAGEMALARLTGQAGRGLNDVSEQPLISDEALRNLIGTFADRLLLVVYGRPSTALVRHEDDERRWRQLRDDVATLPRRPRLLLLASDAHHLDRLCPEGGDVERWLAFPRTTPQR